MEIISLQEVVDAVGGEVVNYQELDIDNVSTDTRQIKSGDLFIALKGERFDGHDFIDDAVAKGAVAVIVSEDVGFNLDKPIIMVEDTLKALQDLAHYYRNKFEVRVVAVTGSTGKTTTKDMIASALSTRYKTLKTEKNFNNEVGLPLTLLQLDSTYQTVVVEMGMRGLGQIERLAQIADPDIAVITNVGVTHIEILKSIDKIAQAKGELVEALDSDGMVILNGDDRRVKRMERLSSAKVINYGLNDYNKVRAIEIKSGEDETVTFHPVINEKVSKSIVKLPLPVEYNVYNALAAISVGLVLDVGLKEIKEGLSRLRLTEMRNQIIEIEDNYKIINDVYNANPTSMRAALSTLSEIAINRKIAVLGDMLELGEIAVSEHNKLGKLIVENDIDYLFTFGQLAGEIGKGAREFGMSDNRIFTYQDKESLINNLLQVIKSNDTILVKGSRGMKLEEVTEALQDG